MSKKKHKSIVIFIDYFGKWPVWFDLFLCSCRKNPTVDWVLHTDCGIPQRCPENVKIQQMSFNTYCEKVSDKLKIKFKPHSAYNICNLKPMFGYLHDKDAMGYDYVGWGDIDVLYGDIRSIYNDAILTHNYISSHDEICSGHLSLMKNEPWLIEAFRLLNGWERRLEDPNHFEWAESLAEARLTALLSAHRAKREELSQKFSIVAPNSSYYEGSYCEEQWSTPFVPKPWIDQSMSHPEVWFWKDGKITNDRDGDREFLYLHFMNYWSKRWVNESLYAGLRPWNKLDVCVHFDIEALYAREPAERGIMINWDGFHLL